MATKLGKSAFPGKAKAAKKPVDLSTVTKCRDPYQPQRVINRHKYDELFAGVKEGDCFAVKDSPETLGAVSRALRLYLKRQGIEGIVRQQSNTADGIGRVWLVKIVKRGELRAAA